MFYLHSTMYLLNLDDLTNCPQNLWSFTFHYVSIKSIARSRTSILTGHHLHSTMYLLNRVFLRLRGSRQRHLHSTMYLLNRFVGLSQWENMYNLHSTMYLLNPITSVMSSLTPLIYIPLCIY